MKRVLQNSGNTQKIKAIFILSLFFQVTYVMRLTFNLNLASLREIIFLNKISYTFLKGNTNMRSLFVEDLAVALNEDVNSLSPKQHRNLCIMLDWALEINALQKDSEYSVFSQLLSNPNQLTETEYQTLYQRLIQAHRAGVFRSLESEDEPDMEKSIDDFCSYLEATDSLLKNKLQLFVASLKEYEQALIAQPKAYSRSLEYKQDFSQTEHVLKEVSVELKVLLNSIGMELDTCSIPAHNWLTLNTSHVIETNPVLQSFLRMCFISGNEISTVQVYLQMMLKISRLKKATNLKVSEETLQFFLDLVAPLLEKPCFSNMSFEQAKALETLLRDLHATLELHSLMREKLAHLFANFVMKNKTVRLWNTPTDLLSKNMPIHRVILFGAEDIADPEIWITISMMIAKHSQENIAVTCYDSDVKEVNKQKASFVLQVIGHGKWEAQESIHSNLGPYRGDAQKTAREVASLANMCLGINHIRLSSCFSGAVAEASEALNELHEKEQSLIEGMRTLTLTTNLPLTPNKPFLPYSAAFLCWNNLRKNNREISLTASPGIIEPDQALGHLTWCKSSVKPRNDDGIKEIRITTPKGPKSPSQ